MSIEKRVRLTGLSLIELIIFIVVISVGLVGILSVMNVTVKGSADPMIRKQAIAMAEAILEEVSHKDYSATLPETDTVNCSNRRNYVGLEDYNCFNRSVPTAVISGSSTLGATGIADLASYTATVKVEGATLGTLAMKKITVEVRGGGETMTLVGYRANL